MKTEGYIDFKGYNTWYAVYGDLNSGVTPLLGLHGGPGYPHYHIKNLSELAKRGMPVVLYDQLGCGSSDRPDNPDLWTIDLFIEELQTIREKLGLKTVNILGHSWGGSLAAEYMFTKPKGVERLILSSPLLDTQLWVEEADKLKDQLPAHLALAMRKHEQTGTTNSREYNDAYNEFAKRFVCRANPYPELMKQADKAGGAQVYKTMWGPSEAFATGTLMGWSALSRLQEITVPTLFLSGRYDEATPRQIQIAQAALPGSTWIMFENSSHSANHEEPEQYLDTVYAFLRA